MLAGIFVKDTRLFCCVVEVFSVFDILPRSDELMSLKQARELTMLCSLLLVSSLH